jgi:hypothetical protein
VSTTPDKSEKNFSQKVFCVFVEMLLGCSLHTGVFAGVVYTCEQIIASVVDTILLQ